MKKLGVLALLTVAQLGFAGTQTLVFTEDSQGKVTNPSCEIVKVAELTVEGNTAELILSNKLEGFCEIFVAPNPITYSLKVISDSCGTLTFEGMSSDRKTKVNLQDHSLRVCEDVRPARMELEISDRDQNVLEYLFSSWN